MILFALISLVVLALAGIVVIGVRNSKRFPIRQATGRREQWFSEKFFGLHVAVGRWFGNCFSPAIVFEWHGERKSYEDRHGVTRYPAWMTITLRFRHKETRIYWRGVDRWDWNSEHIARKWGKCSEQDFGDYYCYKGWLGTHQMV